MFPMPPFPTFFQALHNHPPFPWQAMLAEEVAAQGWPEVLDLPTAAGKTACIDIAVWALAMQAQLPPEQRTAPRRVWFVVDRRIVVDQAFARAQDIAAKLDAASEGPLAEVAAALRLLSGTERPLALGRLRGGVLRDDGWARLPSQPAVLCSTVDQLGSRLLFRGYGASALTASIQAALAGNDSLVLVDEAHCAQPFVQTLQAVARYRGADWATEPIPSPFAHCVLSATVPAGFEHSRRFPADAQRAAALDHPVLHQRLGSAKPIALRAPLKLPRDGSDPLVKAACDEAQRLVQAGRQRVGILVNRVDRAGAIAAATIQALGESAQVALLTGRLRPVERDQLLEQLNPLLRSGSSVQPPKPLVVVATQCLEVGADFSFEALVSEAASLDALRQRLGRLDRLGQGGAEGVLLIRADDAKDSSADPVYGSALTTTWELLHAISTEQGGVASFDGGFGALDQALAERDSQEIAECLSPSARAPVLLPAHLDILCQTAPRPTPDVELDPYLHGSGRRSAEVSVLLRCDLDPQHPELWADILGACPPLSGETLSVPLPRLRRWLAQHGSQQGNEDDSDIAAQAQREESKDNGSKIRGPVLRWAGRQPGSGTQVFRGLHELDRIRPGDTVVLPAAYGLQGLGQAGVIDGLAGNEGLDCYDLAHGESGRPPLLRLHRAVLAPWAGHPRVAALLALLEDEAGHLDRDGLSQALESAGAEPLDSDRDQPLPRWLRTTCAALSTSCRRPEAHPGGGWILRGRASSLAAEPDRFADDDDLSSLADQSATLSAHSRAVLKATARLAQHCLPETWHQPLHHAAFWHDAGKLDERFQVLLHQGDALAALAADEPLAKSAQVPRSPRQRAAIREASGLSAHFRHEMASLEILQAGGAPIPPAHRDLIHHLVASHHGHARPFAPVCLDPAPPALAGSIEGRAVALDAAQRAQLPAAHHPDSGIPERFWALTRRHGWWGLAWLEAVLRLGDWYGSQSLAEGLPDIPLETPAAPQAAAAPSPAHQPDSLALPGLDGSNPLGYLAALGTLVCLHRAGHQNARLAWQEAGGWQPRLVDCAATTIDELADILAPVLRGNATSADAEIQRDAAQKALDAKRTAIKQALKSIKDRKLTGNARSEALAEEVAPLQEAADQLRHTTLSLLRQAVPSPELALGKNIDCDADELHELLHNGLAEAGPQQRHHLDLLAAFAHEDALHESLNKRKAGKLQPTAFCFVTGGGHQDFLDSVRQLCNQVSPERIKATLGAPWRRADEKCSLRWDPQDDRRYALMDRDPTASGNKARTEWMANLLAYHALALFPVVARRGHLRSTGWSPIDGDPVFTWPLWQTPLTLNALRSLLALAPLQAPRPDLTILSQRSIAAALRSRRIRVGQGANFKVNFSPARRP